MPTTPGRIVGDAGPPPPTLGAMLDASDAVVVASVRVAGTPTVDANGIGVSRKHVLAVHEVFKGQGLTTFHPMTLEQHGGVAYVGDRRVTSEGPSTLLSEGQTVLFFVTKSRRGDYYLLPWGDLSAVLLDLVTGQAEISPQLLRLPELRSARTVEDVTTRIRTLMSKRQ